MLSKLVALLLAFFFILYLAIFIWLNTRPFFLATIYFSYFRLHIFLHIKYSHILTLPATKQHNCRSFRLYLCMLRDFTVESKSQNQHVSTHNPAFLIVCLVCLCVFEGLIDWIGGQRDYINSLVKDTATLRYWYFYITTVFRKWLLIKRKLFLVISVDLALMKTHFWG